MRIFSALVMILCLASANAVAKVPGPLVNSEWLAGNAGKVHILDVRKDTASFDEKHIKGAILVAYGKINGKTNESGVELTQMLPAAEAFAALMKSSGVNNDSSIVIVSQGQKPDQVFQATRLYWVLKYFGHDDIAILDGGLAQWVKEKRPVSNDFSDATPGNFTVRAARKEILATTADVAAASKDGSANIFDARGLDQYLGFRYKKGFVTKAGHIPTAKLATSSVFLSNKGPKTFRSRESISAAVAGLNASGNAISYCNSGQYSSALWFVMYELAGNKKAKLYDGSMHAWTKTGQNTITMKME